MDYECIQSLVAGPRLVLRLGPARSASLGLSVGRGMAWSGTRPVFIPCVMSPRTCVRQLLCHGVMNLGAHISGTSRPQHVLTP